MKKFIILLIAILILTAFPIGSEAARKRLPGGPAVRKIHIVDLQRYSEKKIKSLMRTKESRFLRTKHYRESTLESDLVSIVAFYRNNGFLKAQAVVDTIVFDDNHENVWITIRVNEGEQTIVGKIEFVGNLALSDADLRHLIALKAGEPLDERKIAADKYAIYAKYADIGYVYATISHKISGSNGAATVRYVINEGEPALVGSLAVRGNNHTSSKLIEREIELKPGQLFSREKIIDSQQNLYNTGLFKDVDIEPVAASSDSDKVDLLIRVKERKMREISLAVGYGTRDEARMTLGWLHRNLWNTGRELQLRGIVASKDFDKGLTRKRGEAAITDRWLFGRRIVGAIAMFGQETIEDYQQVPGGEYTLVRIGGDFSIKKEFSRNTRLTLTYTHEIVDVREPSWTVENPEELRLTLGQEINRSATLFMERDTRLPFFDPHEGSLLRLVIKRAGGIFKGDNDYSKMTLSWSSYHRFYANAVLAIGLRLGFAEAFGVSRDKGVPEYERFTAGGSSTIRGYDEREFGPGDFLAVGNLEIRYQLFWRLVGVMFLDMGNAWPSIRDVSISDFDISVPASEYSARRTDDVKYSLGLGLGIQTPVGPARLDYGFRLKRAFLESGRKEASGMLHITIGHTF